ncbi:sensor histidine kinase [Niabella aquatica]
MLKVKLKFAALIGEDLSFSPQMQVFHAANLVTAALLSGVIIANMALRLHSSIPLITLIALVHLLIFYLSRYKRNIRLAIAGMFVIGYGGFISSYYFKSGISGPAILIGPFVFLLLLIVISRKYHKYLIPLHILITGLLFLSEYLHPEWIQSVYVSKKEQFIDLFCSLISLLIATYFIISKLVGLYIGQRRDAQQQAIVLAEKNEALQKVTIEKDRLYSLVFHDLKSPLASIQFYLEQFSLLAENSDDHEIIRKDLLLLTQSTSAMLETTLLWIREQVSSTPPQIGPIDILSVIQRAVFVEKSYAERKRISIIIDASLAIVKADGMLLQILIRSIINNAIKFSPPDSEVSITASQTFDQYVIVIRDKGKGIPANIQPELFEKLVQPQFGTNRERGTGVGLLLSRQLASKQNIELRFESQPEKGSTFYISIPISPE